MVSIDDADKFEEKNKKIRPIKNSWYDWLINYIPDSFRKSIGDFKDKIICIFKLNAPKQTMYGREKKLKKLKAQKQSQEEEDYYKP